MISREERRFTFSYCSCPHRSSVQLDASLLFANLHLELLRPLCKLVSPTIPRPSQQLTRSKRIQEALVHGLVNLHRIQLVESAREVPKTIGQSGQQLRHLV